MTEIELKCNVINTYGDGQHPYADELTIGYFNTDYISECIDRAVTDKYSLIGKLKKLKEKA